MYSAVVGFDKGCPFGLGNHGSGRGTAMVEQAFEGRVAEPQLNRYMPLNISSR